MYKLEFYMGNSEEPSVRRYDTQKEALAMWDTMCDMLVSGDKAVLRKDDKIISEYHPRVLR